MIDFAIFLTLLGLGFAFGRYAESRHFVSIIQREKESLHCPVVTLDSYPDMHDKTESTLVTGSVVVSIDYFKRFLAGLRNIFGGRMSSYESLLDRARREAILRMKEAAMEKGAVAVISTRIETSSISKNAAKGSVGSVEVLAYGTALISGGEKAES
ncbi:MAG: YbjQ family protein [Gammaproteobacteria bacterium]|nr:YbjQ family protein [Gammaproteobacteria bacterium]